jgi:hypothetical protein
VVPVATNAFCSVVVPVVVAEPLMVRPPVAVPSPMVVEAKESKPLLKVRVVEVALLGKR